MSPNKDKGLNPQKEVSEAAKQVENQQQETLMTELKMISIAVGSRDTQITIMKACILAKSYLSKESFHKHTNNRLQSTPLRVQLPLSANSLLQTNYKLRKPRAPSRLESPLAVLVTNLKSSTQNQNPTEMCICVKPSVKRRKRIGGHSRGKAKVHRYT